MAVALGWALSQASGSGSPPSPRRKAVGSGWASRDPKVQPFLLNFLLRDNCPMEKARRDPRSSGCPTQVGWWQRGDTALRGRRQPTSPRKAPPVCSRLLFGPQPPHSQATHPRRGGDRGSWRGHQPGPPTCGRPPTFSQGGYTDNPRKPLIGVRKVSSCDLPLAFHPQTSLPAVH